jgi:integrase
VVREFCAFLNFAVDRAIISESVAPDIRKHRDGQLRAWPERVLNKAVDAANPMMRLAITTAFESGQRICDWIGITHEQVETGLVELVQRKTGTEVFIPVSDRWRRAIAEVPRKADTLLYNRFNRPFNTPTTLQNEIRFLMQKIREPGWTFHGLRRNCTNRLAEIGASLHEISAVTGMTLRTVMYYTREIERRRLVRNMIAHAGSADPLRH